MILTFGRTAVAQCPSFTLTCALSMQEIVVLGKYYLQCLQILWLGNNGVKLESPHTQVYSKSWVPFQIYNVTFLRRKRTDTDINARKVGRNILLVKLKRPLKCHKPYQGRLVGSLWNWKRDPSASENGQLHPCAGKTWNTNSIKRNTMNCS